MSTLGDAAMHPAMLELFERRLGLIERRVDFYDARLQAIEAKRSPSPASMGDPIPKLAARTTALEARLETET